MQFNALPDGHEGPQQRRTEFESPEEKLAYDADKLIALAQKISKEKGIAVSPESLITRDDDVVALRKTIAIRLKAKSAANESEVIISKYEAFIDGLEGLNQPEQDREKLKEMVSDANYQKTVDAALERDAKCTIPSKAQILEELMTWSPKKLREICEMQAEPRVVIETNNSFEEQVKGMNAHQHYTAQDGRPQDDAYVNQESGSPYLNAPKSETVVVSITDGKVHPDQLTGVSRELSARRAHLITEYAKKGHELSSLNANAALYQMSLKEAEETGDNSKIIDNWESGRGTVTLINPKSLTESTLVAYSSFSSADRRVGFFADLPGDDYDRARGRASVQVLKI